LNVEYKQVVKARDQLNDSLKNDQRNVLKSAQNDLKKLEQSWIHERDDMKKEYDLKFKNTKETLKRTITTQVQEKTTISVTEHVTLEWKTKVEKIRQLEQEKYQVLSTKMEELKQTQEQELEQKDEEIKQALEDAMEAHLQLEQFEQSMKQSMKEKEADKQTKHNQEKATTTRRIQQLEEDLQASQQHAGHRSEVVAQFTERMKQLRSEQQTERTRLQKEHEVVLTKFKATMEKDAKKSLLKCQTLESEMSNLKELMKDRKEEMVATLEDLQRAHSKELEALQVQYKRNKEDTTQMVSKSKDQWEGRMSLLMETTEKEHQDQIAMMTQHFSEELATTKKKHESAMATVRYVRQSMFIIVVNIDENAMGTFG